VDSLDNNGGQPVDLYVVGLFGGTTVNVTGPGSITNVRLAANPASFTLNANQVAKMLLSLGATVMRVTSTAPVLVFTAWNSGAEDHVSLPPSDDLGNVVSVAVNEVVASPAGTFTVSGLSSAGTGFRNAGGANLRCNFAASGSWTNNNGPQPLVDANGIDTLSPNDGNWFAAGLRMIALITRRGSGAYEFVGTSRNDVVVNAGETMKFVTIDAVGNAYVSLSGVANVCKVTPGNNVSLFKTLPYGGGQLVTDANGNMFVASLTGNGKVAKIATDGTITTFVDLTATGRTNPSF